MCALDEPTWPMGSSERSGLDGRWQSVRVYECASVKKNLSCHKGFLHTAACTDTSRHAAKALPLALPTPPNPSPTATPTSIPELACIVYGVVWSV